jgi:hypothetical protein
MAAEKVHAYLVLVPHVVTYDFVQAGLLDDAAFGEAKAQLLQALPEALDRPLGRSDL